MAIRNYKKHRSNQEQKLRDKGLFQELIFLSLGTKLQSKHVWVQFNRKKEMHTLMYGKTLEILDEYKDVPLLYMDASGDKKVIENLFERGIEFENIPVIQQENAKVYQIEDKSFSRISFRTGDGNKIDSICSWIEQSKL